MIDAALGGDIAACKYILDHVLPKERPVTLDLTGANSPAAAMSALLLAVAAGEITTGEADAMSRVVGHYAKAIELDELQLRVGKVEELLKEKTVVSDLLKRIIKIERDLRDLAAPEEQPVWLWIESDDEADAVLAKAIADGRVKEGQRVQFWRFYNDSDSEAQNVDPTQRGRGK
jgi:hypothetical protein